MDGPTASRAAAGVRTGPLTSGDAELISNCAINPYEIAAVHDMIRVNGCARQVLDTATFISATGPIEIKRSGYQKQGLNSEAQKKWNGPMLSTLRKCVTTCLLQGFCAVTVDKDTEDITVVPHGVCQYYIVTDSKYRTRIVPRPHPRARQTTIYVYTTDMPTIDGHITSTAATLLPSWEFFKCVRDNYMAADSVNSRPEIIIHKPIDDKKIDDHVNVTSDYTGFDQDKERYLIRENRVHAEIARMNQDIALSNQINGSVRTNLETGSRQYFDRARLMDNGYSLLPIGWDISRPDRPGVNAQLAQHQEDFNAGVYVTFGLPRGLYSGDASRNIPEATMFRQLRDTIERRKSMVTSLARWMYALLYGEEEEVAIMQTLDTYVSLGMILPEEAMASRESHYDVEVNVGTAPAFVLEELIAVAQTGVLDAKTFADLSSRAIGAEPKPDAAAAARVEAWRDPNPMPKGEGASGGGGAGPPAKKAKTSKD